MCGCAPENTKTQTQKNLALAKMNIKLQNLVWSPSAASGHETELAYSYNCRAQHRVS